MLREGEGEEEFVDVCNLQEPSNKGFLPKYFF